MISSRTPAGGAASSAASTSPRAPAVDHGAPRRPSPPGAAMRQPEPGPHTPGAGGVRSPGAVEFSDTDFGRWRVHERDARHDPGAHGDRCLVFAGGGAVRRVWEYPPGWRDLRADELVALSWRR